MASLKYDNITFGPLGEVTISGRSFMTHYEVTYRLNDSNEVITSNA